MSKQNEKTQAAQEVTEVQEVSNPMENLSQAELIKMIQDLQASKGKDRKAEILGLIKEGYDTSAALADKANITTKNVASILTALRKEGNHILTMKVGGNNIIKLLSDDEARNIGLI